MKCYTFVADGDYYLIVRDFQKIDYLKLSHIIMTKYSDKKISVYSTAHNTFVMGYVPLEFIESIILEI